MKDDLVKRLRDEQPATQDWSSTMKCGLMDEAADRIEALTAERERLALAICGGEDAPGYANAQTVETLEHVAKQNQLSHGETINSLLAAKAENDRLREALQSLHGFADGWRECGCGDSCYGRHAERNVVLDHLHDFATAALDGETHDA